MSTYGQEPSDPWTEETQPVPPAHFQAGQAAPAAPVMPVSPVPPAPATYQPQQQYAPVAAPEQYGQPGPYPQNWQPPRQRSTALIVLTTLLVVVVLAGAGVGVYLYVNRAKPAPEFIPQAGSCITVDANQQVLPATCGTSGSHLVGKEIPVPTGNPAVATAQCATADPSSKFTAWFHVVKGSGQDYVVCLDN